MVKVKPISKTQTQAIARRLLRQSSVCDNEGANRLGGVDSWGTSSIKVEWTKMGTPSTCYLM